ncbi:MAG: hypothetical protein D4R57_00560 [Verrucomicrobiales bacterium]|nr:MAG: hypothetical protein D4R57_00560 [Verrucomicrobiales bacterium]
MFKLSDFNAKTQADIKRQLAADLRPLSPPVAQPGGRRIAPPAHETQTGRPCRVVVSLIGLRARTLDDDNYVGACKHLRDAIAATLGIDDGDKRISWQYQQIQTRGREGVLVQIEVI